jgi:serine/threonine protein kinase
MVVWYFFTSNNNENGDLKPGIMMLDGNTGTVVTIDFGSCAENGLPIRSLTQVYSLDSVCEGSQAFDLCCLATSIAQMALGSLPVEESVTCGNDKASRKTGKASISGYC